MEKVIIIAEAGVNHNGDIELAKDLIDVAAHANVDYVKFQTFITEMIVDISAPKAAYQNVNIADEISQFQMLKKLELSIDDFEILANYCKQKQVKFLTTAADIKSLNDIKKFNLDFIKISSGEVINKQYLKKVAEIGKPVVLSTGMSTLGEIENAINILIQHGIKRNQITILHCNTEYPTPMHDVNIKAMNTIANALNVKIGYSDHTLGIEIPIAAVALGASVIEKHFTLDRNLPGPDHAASLEPEELKDMVKAIRNVEMALNGSGLKEPSNSEVNNKEIVRKSIFIVNSMKDGDTITDENLVMKRPGDGISAMEIDKVLGKSVKRNIKAGHKLEYGDIKW